MAKLYPINIAFVVFAEPVKTSEEFHDQTKNLKHLKHLSDKFNAKMTILVSGPFADKAITENFSFLDIIKSGNEVGTYVVPQCKIAQNNWNDVNRYLPKFPSTEPIDNALLFRVWSENTNSVNNLIGSTNNKTVHSDYFTVPLEETLVTNNGFKTTFANRSLKGLEYIGHPIEHPFRPSLSLGYEIKENTDTQFVFVDGFTDIADEGKPYSCPDLRTSSIISSFEDLYKNWMLVETNKVWTFIFAISLLRTNVNDEIEQLFDNISHYANSYTSNKELIAKYSTIQEINEEFIQWESVNPKYSSSFSYIQTPKDLALPDSRLQVEHYQTIIEALGFRRLFANVHKPLNVSSKKPGIIMISGDGAITPGFSPNELAKFGYAVIHYDRSGHGQSVGVNNYGGLDDQDDLKTVIEYLKSQDFVDHENIGVISLGFGLSIAAGTLGRYPSIGVRYLIDWEGPSNRLNISQFDKSEDFSQFESTNDTFWNPREPYKTIRNFTGKYLRIQGSIDHFQGTDMSHAIEMINSATNVTHRGNGRCILTVLNGNTPNRIYDISLHDSSISPFLWLQGDSINQIAEDNVGSILKYFKNISNYAQLNISLIVIIPKLNEFEHNENAFKTAADRLRILARSFERANAKLSILVENPFIEGTRKFGDNILSELVSHGHSVGSLLDVPEDSDEKKYIEDTRSNLDRTIGFVNNQYAMGALSLDNPQFLAEIGFRGLVGPLLNRPYNSPRSSIIRKFGFNVPRSNSRFLTIDDPFGSLFYVPGDLTRISIPDGISQDNTSRAINSILISNSCIDPNRSNSWYIFLDITDFTDNVVNEIQTLEQWAKQDVYRLIDTGEVRWKNINDMMAEAQALIDRESVAMPDPPTHLVAQPGDHVANLSWTPSVNVKGYVIYRSGDSFYKSFVTVGTTATNNFADSKVNNDKKYCYIVRAFTEENPPLLSEPSNEAYVTPKNIYPPPAPQISDASVGNKAIALTWTQSSSYDTKTFRIYRCAVNADNPINLFAIRDICDLREKFQLVAEISGDVFKFVDSNLTNNQQYIYIVSAVNFSGNEAFDVNSNTSVVPHDSISPLPIWVGTNLGIIKSENSGESFISLNPCGEDFYHKEPEIAFLKPTPRSKISNPVNVLVAVSDIVGIAKVEVGIGDDKNLVACEQKGASKYAPVNGLDSSPFANGTIIQIFVVVTNSIGIVSRASVPVEIQNTTKPQIKIISPLANETVASSLTIQIEALSANEINNVSTKINDGSWKTAEQIGEFWYTTSDISTFNGNINIIASATDIASNSSYSEPIQVIVNSNPVIPGPRITVLSPSDGDSMSGKIVIAAEVTSSSKIDGLEISFNDGVFQPMISGQVRNRHLMLEHIKYPNWSPDGSKIAFVDITDCKLYVADVDSNGNVKIPKKIWDVSHVPAKEIINAVDNGSFNSINDFCQPLYWEQGMKKDAVFIVIEVVSEGKYLSNNEIYIGKNRRHPDSVPFKIVPYAHSFSQGIPPMNPWKEFGFFMWHDKNPNIWNIAATNNNSSRTIEGSIIIKNSQFTNCEPSHHAKVTPGVLDIHFILNPGDKIATFKFETSETNLSSPYLAEISQTVPSKHNSIRLSVQR